MRKLPFPPLFLAVLLLFTARAGAQALRSIPKPASANVRVHITIDEVVGRKVQTNPIPKIKLYLLLVENTRPLVELQEACRRATADPNAIPYQTYRTCDQNMRQAVTLVSTLPAVATAETDRDGQYDFGEVPPASYKVIAVKNVEDGEPIVIVGATNKLKTGEHVTLNLSANDPWTRTATR